MPTLTERLTDVGLVGSGLRRVEVQTAHGAVSALVRRREGDGPALILLHGLGSCAADLGGLLRRLKRVASLVVAPDLPGFGHSPQPVPGMEPDRLADQLCDALDRLVPRPALVFGSSLGGLAAIRYAQRRPDRVTGLVLASPAGAPMAPDVQDDFLGLLRVSDRAQARKVVDATIARSRVPRPLLAWGLHERFGRPHIQRLLAGVRGDHLLTVEDLRGLPVPVHLMWGDGDKLMPPGQFEWFVRHLPDGSTVERVGRAGHAPYLERADAVARSIRAALQAA